MLWRIAKVICMCGSVYIKFIDMETEENETLCPYCGKYDNWEILTELDYWLKKEV